MKKNVFLLICVVVLLLINAYTLFIVFRMHAEKERGPGGPTQRDSYIIDQLKLDAAQQKQFGELRRQHHELAMHIQHEDERLHDLYFSLLKTDNPDMAKVDSVSTLIGTQRKAQATAAFEHFRQLRAICHDDQKKFYDATIDEIARRVTGPPPPGKNGSERTPNP
jgi:protein CpxP